MKIELNIGDKIYLVSNYMNHDWTRFYLSFEGILIPLGAESLQHVREWLGGRLWKKYEGEEASFYLNFNDPHVSLSVKAERKLWIIRAWDKDGVLLFQREIKEVSPLLSG